MKVVAIGMARDEEDIVRSTVGWMKTQVDEILVADNLSVDRTRAFLEDLGVVVLDDPDPAYRQSLKMSRIARLAAERGAEWIVPFDMDEIHYSPFGRIADVLGRIPPQWLVATAELYDHVATAADPALEDPVKRIGWRRRERAPLHKVACRWREDLVIEQGNHGARYDGGATVMAGQLVIRHFPYRSAEQFVRKARNGAAAYKAATDLPMNLGAHWRGYGAIAEGSGDEACAEIFRTWFWSADPTADEKLIYDPAPAS